MDANASFTVTVKPASPALSIDPPGGNLPAESQGVADSGDLVCKISGGQPPYKIAVSQGAVPPGMGLSNEVNADGSVSVFIEGTPTQSGAFSFGITVTDSAGASAQTRTPVGAGN